MNKEIILENMNLNIVRNKYTDVFVTIKSKEINIYDLVDISNFEINSERIEIYEGCLESYFLIDDCEIQYDGNEDEYKIFNENMIIYLQFE